MGFYGGKDSQGQTWGPVNIAGCWATAEKEMNKWIAVDKDHVDGGLTGTITDLHGVGNWTTSGADCLDITDMECPRDPEPVDATALQVGPGDEEITATTTSRAQRKRWSGSDTAVAWRACGVRWGHLGGGSGWFR